MIGLQQKILMAALSLGIGAVWTPHILKWTGGPGAASDATSEEFPAEVPNSPAGVAPRDVEPQVVAPSEPALGSVPTPAEVQVEVPSAPDSLERALEAVDALRTRGVGVDLSILSAVGGSNSAATPHSAGGLDTERPEMPRADGIEEWLAASTLTATLVGGEHPLALFGSRVLHVGDEVVPAGADGKGGLAVSAIASDHVLFTAKDREYRVDLPAFRTARGPSAGRDELAVDASRDSREADPRGPQEGPQEGPQGESRQESQEGPQ